MKFFIGLFKASKPLIVKDIYPREVSPGVIQQSEYHFTLSASPTATPSKIKTFKMPVTTPPPVVPSTEKLAKLLMYVVFNNPQDDAVLTLLEQQAQHLMPDADFVRQIKDYYR